ncbi:MAG TPA: hypothetical protein VGO93_28590 [Candidatus Xenobia bacterium]
MNLTRNEYGPPGDHRVAGIVSGIHAMRPDHHRPQTHGPSYARGAASGRDTADAAKQVATGVEKALKGLSTTGAGAEDAHLLQEEHRFVVDSGGTVTAPVTAEGKPKLTPSEAHLVQEEHRFVVDSHGTITDAGPVMGGKTEGGKPVDEPGKFDFLDKYLGPGAVAGGAYGTYQGFKALLHHQYAQGTAGVTTGTATAGSGALTTAALVAKDASTALKLTKGAGVLAGVAAVADGGYNIYSGFKNHNRGQIADGGVKTLAGGLLIGGALSGNPVVAGAGALLYGGTLIYDNRKAIGHFFDDVGHFFSEGSNTPPVAVDPAYARFGINP